MTAKPANIALAHRPLGLPARGLPDPPRYDLWPEALRSAEQLRGTLVPCGPGLRGVGWPDSPRVRLAALAPWLLPSRIPAFLSAAWVWGAARGPGRPLRLSMPARSRSKVSGSREVREHELRLGESDLTTFGPFRVTSPLRTATDLLVDSSPFGTTEVVAVRLLFPLIEGGAEAVRLQLLSTRRPHRRQALRRLEGISPEPGAGAAQARAYAELVR
ncbi:hypothetical protein ACR5KS_07980 [Leucobacter sp. W1153]|uniref:hypothetical protein n=1 Tax=Leucobacter sp. W1153 TaxID=3439064 RepID=UPI003F31A6F5